MQFHQFKKTLEPFPLISLNEIRKYFPTFDNRRLVEWQQKEYIKKLRNGYYFFTDRKIDESFKWFAANKTYKPSYISLESALSFYGFIPEGVFQITSCTTLKTNSFKTPVGQLIYKHFKNKLFFGYRILTMNGLNIIIATPEKAIIDYLYLHPEISEADDVLALRWNLDEIKNQISMKNLNSAVEYIGSQALKKRVAILMELLKDEH